ncbi:Alpha/Beta hydrolase protein [Crepidotus variabilis]|uniref:Alpha/Beta hydrolase protein n=1 Tax=Crepidotus variabilis TaxID=179855 RepID=A0A9P6JLH0_9AGAR|nr:Alpha/Beta hydrolase protein [Crepidotus variabilis]
MQKSELQPQDIFIDLPSGVRLEANLWSPRKEDNSESTKLAVCLHPWAWLGGRKDDPALGPLVDPLLSERYHVIQYNARGVGGSSGWSSFTGFSEGKDLQDVVEWSMQKIGNVISVLLVGYSHGSLITSLCPVLPSVRTSHLLLSYPLGPRSWLTLFNSASYTKALDTLLSHPDSKVFVVFGDRDEFTSASRYHDWIASLTGNIQVEEVAGGSHFWHGRAGQDLVNAVKRWLLL